MSQDAYRFRWGQLDGIAVRDCAEPGLVRELIPDIDDPVVAQAFASHGWSTGEIPYDYLALFVRSGREMIVIDAGWGSSADHLQGRFVERLREAGVAPDDVTCVILTHLDDDHAGGVIGPHGEPAFPNARHVIDGDAWTWYTAEKNLAAMRPSMAALYRAMRTALEGRLLLTQGETEVLPGVRVLPAPGHRRGHMAVELVSDGKTLLHLADTVLHPIIVEHPDWTTGYDSVQETIRATRRRLFDRAAKSSALVFFSHTPFPGLGRIVPDGAAWRWEPVDPARAG